MKVLIVEPRKIPYEKEIDDRYHLEDIWKILNGYAEFIYPYEDIIILCNDEGRLRGLQPNRFINGNIIAGTFIIAGNNKGEMRSLTDDEIRIYKKLFNGRSMI